MNPCCRSVWIAISVTLFGLANPDSARSQIPLQVEADSTLNTRVTHNGDIFTIRDGTTVGNNLFHSFQQFSIPEGGVARFANNPNITNILARVTGITPSQIQGIITANGTANLFLMNPNGISFGENAGVSIGGSFVGTTANAIAFQNGRLFSRDSLVSPQDDLLKVNPTALLVNQIPGQTRTIRTTGTFLGVAAGQNLLLVGGNIDLQSGTEFSSDLEAPGGRLELAAIANGSIDLTNPSNRPQISSLTDSTGASVTIGNGSILSVSGVKDDPLHQNGGALQIHATSIAATALPDTAIELNAKGADQGIGGTVGLVAGDRISLTNTKINVDSSEAGQGAGAISITGTNQVLLTGEQSSLSSQTYGKGDGGIVQINGGTIQLTDGAAIKTNTFGTGAAGTVSLQTTGTVEIANQSAISTVSISELAGRGGDIHIQAGTFNLTQNSFLSTQTSSQKDSGNITIQSGTFNLTQNSRITTTTFGGGNAGNIVIDGGTEGTVSIVNGQVVSDTQRAATGKGGNITFQTGTFSLTDGAVSATTGSAGMAGNVQVTATHSVTVASVAPDLTNFLKDFFAPGIFTSTLTSGSAGTLTITTGQLQVQGGARISASTKNGAGQGGSLHIDAANVELVGTGTAANGQLSPSGLFTEAVKDPDLTGEITGNAGNIEVTAQQLTIRDGAKISSQTSTQGNAGNIVLNVRDELTLQGVGSGVFANTAPNSTGNGGSITIDPRQVWIQDGAAIAVGSQGSGRGGDIKISAGKLELDNAGLISAETASGKGGNIQLDLQDWLLLRQNSLISATAGNNQTGGDGGNITIRAPFVIAVPFQNSDIIANAFTGNGGQIRIFTNQIFGLQEQKRQSQDALRTNRTNDISTSSSFGTQGEISIQTLGIDPNRGLVELPANLVDASNQIAQNCSPKGQQAASSFVITGRGGLPPSPTEPLASEAVKADWVTVEGRGERDRGGGGDRGDRGGKEEFSSLSSPPSPSPSSSPPSPSPSSSPPSPSTPAIIEAQSWTVDAAGNIVLVAQPARVQSTSAQFPQPSCSPVSK